MKKIKPSVILIAILIAAVAGASAYYFLVREDSDPVVESRTCTTYNNAVEEQCIEDYVGLTLDAAKTKARKHGYLPKIESIDGVAQGNTDAGGYIIFFIVEDDIVTDAKFLDKAPFTR